MKKRTKKRIDKPNIVRGRDGKPIRCRVCGKTFPLVIDDQNIMIEKEPRIKRTRKGVVVKRVYEHAFCAHLPIPRKKR